MAKREYWNQNIGEWGKFYLGTSHSNEVLKGNSLFVGTYKGSIGRLEARLMKTRYEVTMDFLRESILKDCVFADIGCGTGIFTVAALRLGAKVMAIDFAGAALATTRRAVETQVPECQDRVTYLNLDIRVETIPASDVALAVGIIPYIDSVSEFFDNALRNTNLALVSFVSDTNFFNRVRRGLSLLNVRDLKFHNVREMDACWLEHGFRIRSRQKLGTGFIDIGTRS
jgi:SAM-dependent methyltransferase